jgi:putative heme iron utilization protein
VKLSNEQLRALRLLAHHPDGCAEAVLLADGFHVGELAVLVVEGLAKMQRTAAGVGGPQKNVVWMQITEEGRRAIAE